MKKILKSILFGFWRVSTNLKSHTWDRSSRLEQLCWAKEIFLQFDEASSNGVFAELILKSRRSDWDFHKKYLYLTKFYWKIYVLKTIIC